MSETSSKILDHLAKAKVSDLIKDAQLPEEDRITILRLIFLKYMCDDPIDGSHFDGRVIDALAQIVKQEDTPKPVPSSQIDDKSDVSMTSQVSAIMVSSRLAAIKKLFISWGCKTTELLDGDKVPFLCITKLPTAEKFFFNFIEIKVTGFNLTLSPIAVLRFNYHLSSVIHELELPIILDYPVTYDDLINAIQITVNKQSTINKEQAINRMTKATATQIHTPGYSEAREDELMVETFKEMFPIPNHQRTYQLLVSKVNFPCALTISFSSQEEAEEAIEAMKKQDVFSFLRLYKQP